MENNGAKSEIGFLEPEKVVPFFGVKRGDHVADFGVGHGYFTIPLAREAGGDGKVYAIDIQQSALDVIRAKAAQEHLLNIEYVWADLEAPRGSHLKDQFVDFVLIANILFQVENKLGLMQEAYRVLRQGGRMAMVEWSSQEAGKQWETTPAADVAISLAPNTGGGKNLPSSLARGLGPRPELWMKKESARVLALQSGFELDREFATGSHHYGLLFVKK